MTTIDEISPYRDMRDAYISLQNDLDQLKEYINTLAKLNPEEGKTHGRALTASSMDRTLEVLGALDSVDWVAISLRSVYYRCVSLYEVPKTQNEYRRIQDRVKNMRRRGMLEYEYITDGSRNSFSFGAYDSEADFLESISHIYRRDMWADLPFHVEVLVEKASMMNILYDVASEYGVQLNEASGFNSDTKWYEMVQRFKKAGAGKQSTLLMMTDYDTAGLRMVETAKKRFRHLGVTVELVHVGLLEEHIDRYDLTTRPDKIEEGMRACELDAMTPDQAREVLRDSLRPYAPTEAMELNKQIEESGRMNIVEMAGRLV